MRPVPPLLLLLVPRRRSFLGLVLCPPLPAELGDVRGTQVVQLDPVRGEVDPVLVVEEHVEERPTRGGGDCRQFFLKKVFIWRFFLLPAVWEAPLAELGRVDLDEALVPDHGADAQVLQIMGKKTLTSQNYFFIA